MRSDVELEFSTTLDDVADVNGWLRAEQARLLWDAARRLRPGSRIVEIGSFHGRSTVVLARAAPPDVEIIAIDPHAGNDRGPLQWKGTSAEGQADFDQFRQTLERTGVADRVRHVRLRSADALAEVAGTVQLLYIDGAHGYGPALADLTGWGDRVAPGGTLVIHDAYLSVGVTCALARRLFFSRRFRFGGRSRSMVEYRRQSIGGAEYVANVARQLAPLPWFVRNTFVRLLLLAHLRPLARLLGYRGDGLY